MKEYNYNEKERTEFEKIVKALIRDAAYNNKLNINVLLQKPVVKNHYNKQQLIELINLMGLKKDIKEEKSTKDLIIEAYQEILTENVLDDVAVIVKNNSFLGLRSPLEKKFGKKNVEYNTWPNPLWLVRHKGRKIVITNKKFTDDSDKIVGDIAIGFLG